jgi:hypothetical protein
LAESSEELVHAEVAWLSQVRARNRSTGHISATFLAKSNCGPTLGEEGAEKGRERKERGRWGGVETGRGERGEVEGRGREGGREREWEEGKRGKEMGESEEGKREEVRGRDGKGESGREGKRVGGREREWEEGKREGSRERTGKGKDPLPGCWPGSSDGHWMRTRVQMVGNRIVGCLLRCWGFPQRSCRAVARERRHASSAVSEELHEITDMFTTSFLSLPFSPTNPPFLSHPPSLSLTYPPFLSHLTLPPPLPSPPTSLPFSPTYTSHLSPSPFPNIPLLLPLPSSHSLPSSPLHTSLLPLILRPTYTTLPSPL